MLSPSSTAYWFFLTNLFAGSHILIATCEVHPRTQFLLCCGVNGAFILLSRGLCIFGRLCPGVWRFCALCTRLRNGHLADFALSFGVSLKRYGLEMNESCIISAVRSHLQLNWMGAINTGYTTSAKGKNLADPQTEVHSCCLIAASYMLIVYIIVLDSSIFLHLIDLTWCNWANFIGCSSVKCRKYVQWAPELLEPLTGNAQKTLTIYHINNMITERNSKCWTIEKYCSYFMHV